MELSPGQQRGLFAVVVVVLAGLGAWLIGTGGHHGSGGSAAPSASAGGAQAPTGGRSGSVGGASTGSAGTPPSVEPGTTAQPPPAGTTSAKGQANIYDWLPFSQADLTSAAKSTLAFAAAYGTWSYTETSTAYVSKMNNLVTGQLANTLKASYATPQIAQQRSKQKQVSQGSGGIAQIRSFSFGSRSITFLVNIAQKLTSSQGTSTTTTQYAVTCVPGPGNWEVNDIEYASAGNS
jgi:hypothetical protein